MPSRRSRRSDNASNSRSNTYTGGFHSTPNGWYYSSNWFSNQNSGRPRYMNDMANQFAGLVLGGARPRNNGGHRESSARPSQSHSYGPVRPSQSRSTRTESRSTRQPQPSGGNFFSRGLAGMRLFRALNNSGRTGRR